jgi:hypothetical protein
MVKATKDLDEIANKYNKTKDIKYKDLWYKLIKDNYGTNNTKRRIVSINSCHKNDDGTYVFVGRSKLHGPVRNTKTKTNRIR